MAPQNQAGGVEREENKTRLLRNAVRKPTQQLRGCPDSGTAGGDAATVSVGMSKSPRTTTRGRAFPAHDSMHTHPLQASLGKLSSDT